MARPYDDDESLSVIVLGGMASPGVVTLSGHDREKNWNTQPAKGSVGANDTLNGDLPAKFQASFDLADDGSDDPNPTDFDRWDEFQKVIESLTNGPKPFAMPIYHPDLARQRITEVTNAKIGGMKHDGKGGATVVVTFKEYKPLKKKKAATAIAKGGPSTGPAAKPDPNAAAKSEVAALLAEARKP